MSKKDLKKQIREEKKQAAKRREKVLALGTRVGGIVFVALVLYLFYLALFSRAPVLPPDRLSASDHVRGNPDAPALIMVYGDFQCPSCLTETELIARAWPSVKENVALVFRHFPLDTHRHSWLAARYAEAAGRQGKFWEMHDLLFSNQGFWSGLEDAGELFRTYGENLGLDAEQLQSDLGSAELRDKIIADQQGGVRAGVRATPAIFINGQLIRNPKTAGELIQRIEQALDEKPA